MPDDKEYYKTLAKKRLELLKEYYDISMYWYGYSPVEAPGEDDILARVRKELETNA